MSEESIQLDRYAMDRIYAIGFEPGVILAALPPQCIQLAFDQLTPPNLQKWNPSIVFLPLFGSTYDAATIVEQLESLGFQGDIVVICPTLPRPQLVERELRGLGPGKRLRVVPGL